MSSQREEVTRDYAVASAWAAEFLGVPNVATVWIPAKDFNAARRTATSFSLSRLIHNSAPADESNPASSPVAHSKNESEPAQEKNAAGIYGLAFGEAIEIDPEWTEFSLPRAIPKELTQSFTLDGQWDAYFISASSFTPAKLEHTFTVTLNDVEGEQNFNEGGITAFLKEHAPQLSTWPGSDEVLSWVTLRNSDGAIVGVAAITEWESGGKLLSSVAVHSGMRGKGIGEILVKASVERAAELGIDHLLLAVERANLGAIRLYEKVGFTLLGRFNHFSRPD